MSDEARVPVTYDHCEHLSGPFFHGTRALLEPGEELVAGHRSNFATERVMNNIYFTAQPWVAGLGAQLASALAGGTGLGEDRGHVYEVEPTGPFEDDPNVTDKKFPGNPTESYRSVHPLRIVREVADWPERTPEQLQQMLDNLQRLRAAGEDVIYD